MDDLALATKAAEPLLHADAHGALHMHADAVSLPFHALPSSFGIVDSSPYELTPKHSVRHWFNVIKFAPPDSAKMVEPLLTPEVDDTEYSERRQLILE